MVNNKLPCDKPLNAIMNITNNSKPPHLTSTTVNTIILKNNIFIIVHTTC